MVAVLTMVSIFAFIDRQILSLLVQPIRRDMEISDTQMSLLLGFSFAVCFTAFAMPLARVADWRSRKAVLGIGLAGWSICTIACGLARSFWQMMMFRMGVGIGEATLNPCAHSMIADSFPPERRSTALSVFSMGLHAGSGLALVAGGLVVQFASGQEAWQLPLGGTVRPWQLILLQLGLAGLLFTFVLATLREPPRRRRAGVVPMSEVAAYVARNRRTILCHHLGFALLTMAITAGAAWLPEMFRRNFHWSIPKFGVYFGLEVAIFGCLGSLAAGRMADHMLRRGIVDANLRVATWLAMLALPLNLCVFLAPSGDWAILWLALAAAVTAAPYGVAAAAMQQIAPSSMRSQMAAIYVLAINLIGTTTGPTVTALLTQHVFRREDALNYSLAVVHLVAFLAGASFLRAGWKPFRETLERLAPTAELATAAAAAPR